MKPKGAIFVSMSDLLFNALLAAVILSFIVWIVAAARS